MTDTPDLPDGYDVRHEPPRRGVIGARDTWYVTYQGQNAFRVFDPSTLATRIAQHQAAGAPVTPTPKTRREQERETIIAAYQAGESLARICADHFLTLDSLLRIVRPVHKPRFEDQDTPISSIHPKPAVRRLPPRTGRQPRFRAD